MSTKHNREFLAKTLNDEMGKTLTLKEAERIIAVIVEAQVEALLETGELRLNSYGKLKVTARAARTGRNPKNGEAMHIAARNTVAYKPSPSLLRKLN
ncbi:MAG: HU family DNA-binding protein [Blastocatellia bacterium]